MWQCSNVSAGQYVALILTVDMAGVPNRWVVVEDAITYYARQMVAWSLGSVVASYRGGYSRVTGKRSQLSTRSIIAIKGAVDFMKGNHEPHLSNAALYAFSCSEYDLSSDSYESSKVYESYIKNCLPRITPLRGRASFLNLVCI